jgi:hypothetical protein
MTHHTKDKGDCGVGFVIADLLKQGFQPAILISEHLPFDLVAISPAGRMARVSVKYRKMVAGSVRIQLNGNWTDKNGTHKKRTDLNGIDGFAIYCPDTDSVYYVRATEVALLRNKFSLRISPSANNQKKNTRLASDYTSPCNLFFGTVV